MNAKKTIATIGLTGVLGLTTIGGVTPAMASDHGGTEKHKGNSVSQAAHTKAKGESNREAAHAHAPGQQKKITPVPPVVVAPSPEVEAPVEAPIVTPVENAPEVEVPIEAPVEVAPVVEAPIEAPVGNVSVGDISSDGNSLLDSVLSDDNKSDDTELVEADSNSTYLGGVSHDATKYVF